LTRGAGGGQQFFASLVVERKRFIRELTAVGHRLKLVVDVDQVVLFRRSNFPGMKLRPRYIGRGLWTARGFPSAFPNALVLDALILRGMDSRAKICAHLYS